MPYIKGGTRPTFVPGNLTDALLCLLGGKSFRNRIGMSAMKMRTPDGTEVMELDAIERAAGNLLLKTRVMGEMPMTIVLTPKNLREGIGLLNWRLIPFALGFILRSLFIWRLDSEKTGGAAR